MAKLSFNDVLEAKLVERVGIIDINTLLSKINLLIGQPVSEPKEKNWLEIVPLQETETNDV